LIERNKGISIPSFEQEKNVDVLREKKWDETTEKLAAKYKNQKYN
jgi:hypothetical protein